MKIKKIIKCYEKKKAVMAYDPFLEEFVKAEILQIDEPRRDCIVISEHGTKFYVSNYNIKKVEK